MNLVPLFVVVFLICSWVASSCFFVVEEAKYAIVMQLGKIVRVIEKSGLFFKIPVLENVVYLNSKILGLSAESKEFIASDQKRLVVDWYAKYKIADPVVFFKSVGNERRLSERLESIVESNMREKVGYVTLIELLNDSRASVLKKIHESVKSEVLDFGVEMIDVRIRRADLPEQNSSAVFKRMDADRHKEAKEIRAEGEESASKIRSDADSKSSIIVSESKMQSEIMIGEAEGKAAEIYRMAISINPQFFQYYRVLAAYKKSFSDGKSKFIMSQENEFLTMFNDGVK